jgi:hypothetical protein
VRHFVPHALIILVLVALAAGTLPETTCLGGLLGAHLLVPVWSASIARPDTRVRAIVLGPGTVIGFHVIALLITLLSTIGGVPEGTWITLMMVILWAFALAAYALYCAITFSIITRVRSTGHEVVAPARSLRRDLRARAQHDLDATLLSTIGGVPEWHLDRLDDGHPLGARVRGLRALLRDHVLDLRSPPCQLSIGQSLDPRRRPRHVNHLDTSTRQPPRHLDTSTTSTPRHLASTISTNPRASTRRPR